MKRLRRSLVAGILVWLPLGVTIFLLRVLMGLVDKTLGLIPPDYRPEALVGFNIPGLYGFILTFLVLLITGIFAANIVGRSLVNL